MKRDYVYPNVAAFNRGNRGGLRERWKCALETINCEYIEVPADFIKNQTEVIRTNLPLGSFLTREAISTLYNNSAETDGVNYILHSEFRSGSYLQWNKPEWVEELVKMLICISKHFKVPPMAVEIHPGGSRKKSKISKDNLIEGARKILQGYEKYFSHLPLILLENRTNQFISTGEDLGSFWETASTAGKDIIEQLGIVLDIQQLFTSLSGNKEIFLEHFGKIPDEAIKGVHIHHEHGKTTQKDPIPWYPVFSRLSKLSDPLIINPEVHHHKDVSKTIEFCEYMFSNSSHI